MMTMAGIQVEQYTVTYESDGLQVKGLFAVPSAAGVYPPLLYCRGGMKNVGKVRPARIAKLAAAGYAVFAPHYRGNEGGEGRDEFGGADRQDVFAAVRVLGQLHKVDRTRKVGVIGFSRGSIMTLLAVRDDAPDEVRQAIGAAAVWCGVSDLRVTFEEREDLRRMLRRVVGNPNTAEPAYIDRSPARWAERIERPVLIVHGREDDHVDVGHAERLADALQQHEKVHRLIVFEGEGHHFSAESDREALDRIFAWFGEHC